MFTTSGFVQFAVTQRMVPSSRLLLFYVRDDLETVADNMQIDVEDKLENEVIRIWEVILNNFIIPLLNEKNTFSRRLKQILNSR